MNFIITVKSERLSANYSASTILDAIRKAESYAGLGKVTIIDPDFKEWSSEHFDLALRL